MRSELIVVGDRQQGKTTWLCQQVAEARQRGDDAVYVGATEVSCEHAAAVLDSFGVREPKHYIYNFDWIADRPARGRKLSFYVDDADVLLERLLAQRLYLSPTQTVEQVVFNIEGPVRALVRGALGQQFVQVKELIDGEG